jgi:N-methylhydantoinase A
MGPTIASRIIGELGIGRILVPPDPGTFSAFGMLVTDVHQSRSLTRITRLDDAEPARLEQIFAELEAAALAELLREQFPREQLTALRTAGIRYRGQSYEVGVAVGALRSRDDIAELGKRFHEAHRRRYGHMAESEAIEIVNFQVTAVGRIPKPRFGKAESTGRTTAPSPHGTREAYFDANTATRVPVFRRAALGAGTVIEGPAVIEEKTSTIVLYPGQRAAVDGYLNIEINA